MGIHDELQLVVACQHARGAMQKVEAQATWELVSQLLVAPAWLVAPLELVGVPRVHGQDARCDERISCSRRARWLERENSQTPCARKGWQTEQAMQEAREVEMKAREWEEERVGLETQVRRALHKRPHNGNVGYNTTKLQREKYQILTIIILLLPILPIMDCQHQRRKLLCNASSNAIFTVVVHRRHVRFHERRSRIVLYVKAFGIHDEIDLMHSRM